MCLLQVTTGEDFRALTCLNSIHLQLGNPNSPSVPHCEVPCRSLVTFKIPGLLSKQETPNTIDVVPSTTVTWTHFCPHLTGKQTGTGRGVLPWSTPLSWPWGVSHSPASMGLLACMAAAPGRTPAAQGGLTPHSPARQRKASLTPLISQHSLLSVTWHWAELPEILRIWGQIKIPSPLALSSHPLWSAGLSPRPPPGHLPSFHQSTHRSHVASHPSVSPQQDLHLEKSSAYQDSHPGRSPKRP